jgi:hypothetical protein
MQNKIKNKIQKVKKYVLTNLLPNQLATSKGFTVLFASLIGALVLSIGLAILNITLKQNTLSSAGRKTQQSFYAADAGVECALFLDRGEGQQSCRLGYFGTPSTTGAGTFVSSICGNLTAADDTGRTHECLGRTFTINHGSAGSVIVDTFEVTGDATYDEDICFSVSVIKSLLPNDDGVLELTTTFESRGYNTCDTNSPNRFERAIRVINS